LFEVFLVGLSTHYVVREAMLEKTYENLCNTISQTNWAGFVAV